TSEKRALLTTNGTGRIASTVYSQLPFNLSLSTRDGAPHKFSFYFLDWDRASWKFNLRVYTQAGVLLDERQISSFENGKYFSWIGQGSLRFEFTPLVSFAVMGGLFIDPAPSIEGDISLINPQFNSTFPLNTNVLLEASVTAMATSPQNVEFFVNGNAVSSSTQNPYYTRWVPGTTGTFELFARMHTANGGIKDSSPVQLSITNSSAVTAKAIFEKVDSITAGSWRNAYGTEGYSIFLDNTLISDPLRLVHSGDQSYVWAAFTDESRALQNSGSSSRSATVWYADDSFELLAGSSDGLWHRFSLYCLDWDYGWRQQKISIMDASTESLLDTQIVTNFYDGKYLTWKVRGSIIAKVESIAGEAVVSGIFYDPIPPIDQWRLDQFATLAPDQITDNADPDHDGIPNLLEYKLGSNPLENEVFPAFASAKNNGSIHLVIHVNPLASDVDVLFESSSDLKSWAPAARVDFYSLDPGQGQDTVDYRISEPKGIEFFRLKAVRK
ncbi:MAG: Ig-like domain-containing protein, partial [Verrucomicrobiota bacterium]